MYKLITIKHHCSKSVHGHIMYLGDLGAKINALKMGFDIPFMIHLALVSLPDEYENLISSYNNMKEKWIIDELISHIVLDEGKLKKSNKDHINNIDNKRKFHDKGDNNNVNIILKPHASPIRTHLRTRPVRCARLAMGAATTTDAMAVTVTAAPAVVGSVRSS
jgi:hypothetical protein